MPGVQVNQSQGPAPRAYQIISDYGGGTNLIYTGYADSDQLKDQVISVSAASNASPVSFTATSHGFDYQSLATATPAVKITGGTGNWAAINGVWIATPTSANAFTIPVDSTAFGALTGTLVVTTRAPLTSNAVWAISKNVYDAGGKLIWAGWAAAVPGAGTSALTAGSPAQKFIWNNRTSLAYS